MKQFVNEACSVGADDSHVSHFMHLHEINFGGEPLTLMLTSAIEGLSFKEARNMSY